MALFRRLRDAFSPTVRYVYGGDWGVSVADMDAAALYRTQPNLRAVISFLADNAAQIPLKVHDRAADNDRPRVTDSPAALLLQRPNADMTPFEFKRWLYSDLLLYERFLCLIAPSPDAPSGWELRPVPNRWIHRYEGHSPFAPEAVYVGAPNVAPLEVPSGRFILFHGYDPTDPMRQYSRVSALKETLHEQVESNAFRRQMWGRGGRFNAYLTRPKDVEKWSNDGFERFKESWKASWAGSEAGESGGMPILEDGMEIRTVPFNSRDAQWAESVRLSREDCAAIYHVNPALIWPGTGQTYASARDNARALYNDTLAPLLMQATDRVNMALLPMVGEEPSHYVVYDITIKTQGTLEERISAMQTACGGPFMSREEVRALLDLPREPDGELIVPLNVVTGGLASSHDTDPTVERYNAAPVAHVDEHGDVYGMKARDDGTAKGPGAGDLPEAKQPDAERGAAGEPESTGAPSRMVKGDPSPDDADELAEVFRAFFERQAKSVLPKIEGKSGKASREGDPPWWDAERWNRELADDLYPVAIRQADAAGERAVDALWPDDPSRNYGKRQTAKFLRRMCEVRAEMVNASTLKGLRKAVADGKSAQPGGAKGTFDPLGFFENLKEYRSLPLGKAFAAALSGFATQEACRQNVRRGENVYKTWRTTSGKPRKSHAAMNGETVPYDKPFSNGLGWPGDWRGAHAVSAAESANCKCVIDVEVREKESDAQRHQRRIDEAEIVHPDFYSLSVGEVAAEREKYDSELRSEWNNYKAKSKVDGISPKTAYDTTVGKYFSSLSEPGRMEVDSFVNLKDRGHEVQLSRWFADSGHTVRLRASEGVNDTNDSLLDGSVWEFKRIASKHRSKIVKRVTEHIPRQGPRFVVDLSESPIKRTDAERIVAELLDKDGVEEIMLVMEGNVKRFKR